MMTCVVSDVRVAIRTLTRRRAFSVAAASMLAVGLGGATAMASVLRAVIAETMPYPDADRLVWMWGTDGGPSGAGLTSPMDFRDMTSADLGFARLGGVAFGTSSNFRVGDGDPREVIQMAASEGLLDVLGLAPSVGRFFEPADEQGGAPTVAVVSHRFWITHFGGDPSLVGRAARLDGVLVTIVGVLPQVLEAPFQSDVWVPFAWGAPGWDSRQFRFIQPIGRIAAGSRLEVLQQRLDALSAATATQHPATNQGRRPVVQSLSSVLVGDHTGMLTLLFAATLLVMVVAIANVANLVLVNAFARESEIHLRRALGASRSRVFRQLFAEGAVLGVIGAVAGVFVAVFHLKTLVTMTPVAIPGLARAGLDLWMLAFALGASSIAAIVFGAVSAWHLRQPVARGISRVRTGGSSSRIMDGLAAIEVAMTLVVLASAGLLASSVLAMRAADPGFSADAVYTLSVRVPAEQRGSSGAYVSALDHIQRTISAVPGVEAVTIASKLPLTGAGGEVTVRRVGDASLTEDAGVPAQIRSIAGDYLQTLGIRLLHGRDFDARDVAGATLGVLVNSTLARQLFNNDDPVGRRLTLALAESREAEIIGVVSDVRQLTLTAPSLPEFYLSMAQEFQPIAPTIALRTNGMVLSPRVIAGALRSTGLDLAVGDVMPLSVAVAQELAGPRFQTRIFMLFAVFALLLALGGVYTVLSFVVHLRRREIGIRMACGANPRSVAASIMLRGARTGFAGVSVGITVMLLVGRWLSPLLFQTTALNPVVLGASVFAVFTVVAIAAYFPARRASALDAAQLLKLQ